MERTHQRRGAALALAILLACCNCASALDPSLDVSQYAHTTWKVREGFFQGITYAIAQTPDGYLWLGTEFGLLRFDGVRAIPWQPPAGEHLPSGMIRRLLVARDGTLWIGTANGLASWKNGRLTQRPELAGQQVTALLEDREGTLWVGTGKVSVSETPGRLCAIHGANTHCYGEDGSLGQEVYSVFEDARGNLWAGSARGLWRWKPGPPQLFPAPNAVPEFIGLAQDENGALLINMPTGLYQFAHDRIEPYPLLAGRTFSSGTLLRDRNGGLWIATHGQGLLHIHNGRADVFKETDGLSGDWVTNLFEDREGDIWVATLDGIDRFHDFAVPTISVKQGLSDSLVVSVLAAKDGSVWLGTQDGLNRWKQGQVTIYRKQTGLPDDRVESLYQDGNGRVWVSTHGGVAYFNNGRFNLIHGVRSEVANSISEDRAGNLWVSDQQHGLLRVVGGDVVEQIPWATLRVRYAARTLAADPLKDGMWLGSVVGGLTYFRNGQVQASYGVANGLGEGQVESLQIDRDGTLWAATEGGLSRVNNGRVETLTRANGLPCNTIHWMMQDAAHSVWLYTSCGLVRVARADLDAWATQPKRMIQATLFDNSDGVRSHSIAGGYPPHVARTADGKLWFATFDGVSVLDPAHLAFNKLPPPVHIEQITGDHKTYWQNLSGDAPSSRPKLPPLVRDLEIDYSALSFVAPEKVHFRVKLEGWDRDWKNAGNERKAFYNNLPPRNYRFRVIACNDSGVWNETGDTFDFSITPAYYQTRWFPLLCIAVLGAALWWIFKLRVRGMQLHAEQLALMNAKLETQIGQNASLYSDLQRNEAYLSQGQSISHTGSFGRNAHFGEIYWSEETYRIFDCDRSVTPTLEWVLNRIHPEDREHVRQTIDRATEERRDFELEYRLLRSDDSIKYLHVLARAVESPSGDLEYVGTVTDITDRKRAEEALRKAFEEIKDLRDQLYRENLALKEEIDQSSMFEEIVGTSPALRAVLSRVSRVAPTDSTVLITGETGTGKELIARAIHKRSQRHPRSFVSVNCAAIPRDLIASELFGHEKGAFTGAVQRRIGRFELAEGGTIFLDEIGELPSETQIALLRVLQEREFERVGGTVSIRADVRVLAATNRDLQAAIAAKSFRGDLFYRLNVFPIEVPPLRERREDIPLLVAYFIDRYARKAGKRIRRVTKQSLDLLQSYSWPGNIRELQNIIERSVIVCDTENFSVDESWLSPQPPRSTAKAPPELSRTLANEEREIIEAALRESGGRVSGPSGAAVKLGIPGSTLDSKIRSLKIDKNRFKPGNPSANST